MDYLEMPKTIVSEGRGRPNMKIKAYKDIKY